MAAPTADAIDAVRGSAQGLVEIDLVVHATGHTAQPDFATAQSRFDACHVKRTILPGVVEGDDAQILAGRRHLEFAICGSARGEAVKNVCLSQDRSVHVVAEGNSGERPGVTGNITLLIGSVVRRREANHCAWQKVDVAHTEWIAGKGGGADQAGGGVLSESPNFQADLPIRTEGVGSVVEEQAAVAVLDQLARGNPTDDPFKDALIGASKTGADEGGVGTQSRRASDRDAVLQEVQIDRRVRTEICNRQIIDPLHDRGVVVGDGGVRVDRHIAADVARDD